MYKKYITLRDEKGVTDYAVSKGTGIAASVFSEWKKGRSSPKIDKLQKIATFFGVSITYFLDDTTQSQ